MKNLLDIIYLLGLLIPLIPIFAMLRAKTDNYRRLQLINFAASLVMVAMPYTLVWHAINYSPIRDMGAFHGFGAAALNWFYANAEAFIVYSICAAALCYWANKVALRRIAQR